MYEDALKGLQTISQAVGNDPDYVQGGGGNTSVKIDGTLMAVKASGYKLNQITSSDGFVVVDYAKIREYYASVDLDAGIDYEKDSTAFVQGSIVALEGLKVLRPSIEAGFHSLLKKYVIHTHPVYANILCCAGNGQELVAQAFSTKPYNYLWIPYIKPGFTLTLKMKSEIDNALAQGKQYPTVIFMENHGLIVTSDDAQECIALHQEVNDTIKAFLRITEEYPQVSVRRLDDNTFASATPYVVDFFKGNTIDMELFNTVLYPDQLVYLNGNLNEGKIRLNPETGEMEYQTLYSEAVTVEETLAAWLYVMQQVKEHGYTLKTMPSDEIDFIRNWEGEKYRKSLLSNMKK